MDALRAALKSLRADSLKAHKSKSPELMIRIGLIDPEQLDAMEVEAETVDEGDEEK